MTRPRNILQREKKQAVAHATIETDVNRAEVKCGQLWGGLVRTTPLWGPEKYGIE
jgi:hypothetical protein